MSQDIIKAVIHADEIRRVVIRNEAGEAVSSIHVPDGGTLVLDVVDYILGDPADASKRPGGT
jgi:hypothetical protein